MTKALLDNVQRIHTDCPPLCAVCLRWRLLTDDAPRRAFGEVAYGYNTVEPVCKKHMTVLLDGYPIVAVYVVPLRRIQGSSAL